MLVLSQIGRDHDLVVKPADEGGAPVLWDKEKHIAEASNQLSDRKFYEPNSPDENYNLINGINSFLEASYKLGAINDITKDFLRPTYPTQTRLFYLLPKIHKKGYLVEQ